MLSLLVHLLTAPAVWSGLSIFFNSGFNSAADRNFGGGVASASTFVSSSFTPEETKALFQFRKMVKDALEFDYEKSDDFLIPWVRAHDMNLFAAEKMLRAAKKWRKDNRMDTILNETINVPGVNAQTVCIVDGVDREGSPISILDSGSVDMRKVVVMGKIEDLHRFILQCSERAIAKMRRLAKVTGKKITQTTAIVDFGGYNTKSHACMRCVRSYMDYFKLVEDFYPEQAKHFVVINAPLAARPVMEMAKTLMTANSARALKVFGTDAQRWKSYLREIIAPEELPFRYGGTRGNGTGTKCSINCNK